MFNSLSLKTCWSQRTKLIWQASHGCQSAFCKLALESELCRQWSALLCPFVCSSESQGHLGDLRLGSTPGHAGFRVKTESFRSGRDCPLQLCWYSLGRNIPNFFFFFLNFSPWVFTLWVMWLSHLSLMPPWRILKTTESGWITHFSSDVLMAVQTHDLKTPCIVDVDCLG